MKRSTALKKPQNPSIPSRTSFLMCPLDTILFGKETARVDLGGVTKRIAGSMTEARLCVSPKSTLDPLEGLFCLGKILDLEPGEIFSPLILLWQNWWYLGCAWGWLGTACVPAKFFGVPAAQVGAGPQFVGPLAWTRWGPAKCNGVPKGVLESLAQVLGHALLPLSKTNCLSIPALVIDMRSLQNLTSIKLNTVKHEANGIFVPLGVYQFPLYYRVLIKYSQMLASQNQCTNHSCGLRISDLFISALMCLGIFALHGSGPNSFSTYKFPHTNTFIWWPRSDSFRRYIGSTLNMSLKVCAYNGVVGASDSRGTCL